MLRLFCPNNDVKNGELNSSFSPLAKARERITAAHTVGLSIIVFPIQKAGRRDFTHMQTAAELHSIQHIHNRKTMRGKQSVQYAHKK